MSLPGGILENHPAVEGNDRNQLKAVIFNPYSVTAPFPNVEKNQVAPV